MGLKKCSQPRGSHDANQHILVAARAFLIQINPPLHNVEVKSERRFVETLNKVSKQGILGVPNWEIIDNLVGIVHINQSLHKGIIFIPHYARGGGRGSRTPVEVEAIITSFPMCSIRSSPRAGSFTSSANTFQALRSQNAPHTDSAALPSPSKLRLQIAIGGGVCRHSSNSGGDPQRLSEVAQHTKRKGSDMHEIARCCLGRSKEHAAFCEPAADGDEN